MTTGTNRGRHTPGPWHVNAIMGEKIVGGAEVPNADKYMINNYHATVARVFRAKDARLIAAAPEMLEALRVIAKWDPAASPNEPGGMSIIEAIDIARAAIHKAEGGAE